MWPVRFPPWCFCLASWMRSRPHLSWPQELDLFGPMVEFLTSPQEASIDFCVLRAVIPPGISVPLHSHPDTESADAAEGLAHYATVSAKYGYWNATPEENAAVG